MNARRSGCRMLIAAALLALPTAGHCRRPAAPRGSATRPQPRARRRRHSRPARYRRSATAIARVFAAIRDERWTDAQIAARRDEARPAPRDRARRALHRQGFAQGRARAAGRAARRRARTAPGRAARAHGADAAARSSCPPCPPPSALIWHDGAPRPRARASRSRATLPPPISRSRCSRSSRPTTASRRRGAARQHAAELTPEALTEWQQKVAWIYYPPGRRRERPPRWPRKAQRRQRRMGGRRPTGSAASPPGASRIARAAGRRSSASPRAPPTPNCAPPAFTGPRAPTWRAAAPSKIEARLKAAAQYRRDLLRPARAPGARRSTDKPAPRRELRRRATGGARAAAPTSASPRRWSRSARTGLADEVLRHQAQDRRPARACRADPARRPARTCPRPQLWLSHNCPPGVTPPVEARYPDARTGRPTAAGASTRRWSIAHTLQELRFRTEVRQPRRRVWPDAGHARRRDRCRRASGGTYARRRDADQARRSTWRSASAYLEQLRDHAAAPAGCCPR